MILWADSFDHYGDTETNLTDGPWAQIFADLSTLQARTGDRSLQLGAGSAYIARRVFGGPKSVAGVGMALYLPQLPSMNKAMTPIEFRDGTNACQLRVVIESTGVVSIYLGPYGDGDVEPTTSSTTLIRANSWNHLEAVCGVDSASGFCEVRLNGVTIINATALDTDPTGADEVSQYATLNQFNRLADGPWYIDDVIAWDDEGSDNTTFLGDKKVFTDFPNADGADVDWTPSSGATRWQMVDEADPDDDATYDEAVAEGEVMGLGYPALDPSVVSVAAVILIHRSAKTDAGTCAVQQAAISGSGAEEIDGDENPLTTAYAYYQDVFEVDPATGALWTPDGVNAMDQLLTRTA